MRFLVVAGALPEGEPALFPPVVGEVFSVTLSSHRSMDSSFSSSVSDPVAKYFSWRWRRKRE